jgi:hypothetical protein
MILTDASGNSLWSRTIATSPTELITGCVPAENGSYIISGQSEYKAKGNHDIWMFKISDPTAVSVDPINEIRPRHFKLYPNYPNPFNPATTIQYELQQSSLVSLNIYNLLGQKIRTLFNQSQSAGKHDVIWNGKNDEGVPVSSGVYLYRLECNNSSLTKKLTLMK